MQRYSNLGFSSAVKDEMPNQKLTDGHYVGSCCLACGHSTISHLIASSILSYMRNGTKSREI